MCLVEISRQSLDPKRKLVDEVVDWLAERVRMLPEGVRSLGHFLVVVPTAQSGRSLRLKLAEKLGAVIPPEVRTPPRLVVPDDADIASRTDELLAFQEALGEKGTLAAAAQFSDIRGILGANALSFADVAAKVGDILTDEIADFEVARWQEFAALEEKYYAALAKRGKTDRIAAMKKTIADPPHLAGIETIVLAGLLDPLPALRQVVVRLQARDGMEVVELAVTTPVREGADGTVKITPCATAASEAEKVADFFAAVKPTEALPALCVADPEEFPEIQGALQAKGMKVHDPSRTPLVTSSLGHLVEQIASLVRTRSYTVFSAFVRSGDVRRWLCAELKISPEEYVEALTQLDNAQAELLPETVDDIGPKTKGKLRAIFEHVGVCLRKKGIRQILQAVFKDRLLDERDPDAREFAAAAELVNELLDECSPSSSNPQPSTFNPPPSTFNLHPSTPNLQPSTFNLQPESELFAFRLRESSYSLEPDEGDVILTDGWLEVPFLSAEELVVVGFNEGRVPESVVGHAFLPDRLRRGLGLPDNESRAARDRAILALATACRKPGAVRISFRAIDAKGDVLKPSRLLFEGTDDAEFLRRVRTFYGVRAGTEEAKTPDLPANWKLKLEIPPARKELTFTSPSSLDLYLHCPFTYCLKKTFGERQDDRADELDPSEFGNLAHNALERWGEGPLKDSEDAEAIAAELATQVDALLGERFGTSVPAIVALQGESMKRRLACFARIQAERHAQGWRTVAAERKLQVVYGHTTVKGRCDRIDFNAQTGEWCVIDYKTFDNPDRAVWFDAKKQEWKSLQLPLYCAMLDADSEFPEAKLAKISSAYCILGKTAETTLFTGPLNGAFVPEAEAKVRELVDRIERGIFWPPSPRNDWQWDFADWIFNTPEESVDPAWLADQQRRICDDEVPADPAGVPDGLAVVVSA